MIIAVLDASALLAWLQDEPGADVVNDLLEKGAACSAVNYAEVAQKVLARGGNWVLSADLMASYDLQLEPAIPDDAVVAAVLWKQGDQLSLADRFCLATAQRLGVPAWTTDRAWGEGEGIRQVR
ncbi:MAG: type II toxin-antitoxin system VapC family toxin [Propionicimonas sp.]|uniref:type II toxin-antitoxin system VapC family toxin n=1 Tax=Propionicimonas sp. TaxID=1955623 RepID=UPI003D0B0F4C